VDENTKTELVPQHLDPSLAIKKGDYFYWRYKDEKLDADYLNYWCCTKICLADDTHVHDIYWSDNSGHRGTYTHADAIKKLNLTFIVNAADIERIEDWTAKYYKPEDIVVLHNPNSSRGNVYRRKGAEWDRETIIILAEAAVEKWKRRELGALENKIQTLELIQALRQGCDLKNVYVSEP
jgi:hypothetical protein